MVPSPAGSILLLRLFRLGHLPPALYAGQVLQESGLPLLVVEFGHLEEKVQTPVGGLPRVRISNRWAKWAPRKLRSIAINLGTFVQLIWWFARKGAPSALYVHGTQENFIALPLRFLFNIPIINHVHEIYEPGEVDRLNRIYLWISGLSMKCSSYLLFPEKTRAQILIKKYGLNAPYSLVYNCPRLRARGTGASLRQRLGLPKNAFLMGYFGGISRLNALEEAVLALAEVPSAHLLIWGWGDTEYRRTLEQLTKNAGVVKRVHFLGVLDSEKWDALDTLDAAYCVYRPEKLRLRYAATASNKLFEALAAGVPVITNGERDFRQLVQAWGVGFALNCISSNEIAQALKRLVSDDALRSRMRANALKAHAEEFHFERQFKPALVRFLEVCAWRGQPAVSNPQKTGHRA